MNLTLSVDETSKERANAAAQAMGTSLNQILLAQIAHLAGSEQREAEHQAFEERCFQSTAILNGWKFSRDEANLRG